MTGGANDNPWTAGATAALGCQGDDSERQLASAGVAVVTGASGGVGRATVRELARRGFDIGLLARGHAGLDAAAAEVRSLGRRAVGVQTDVAVFEEVDSAAQRVVEQLGPIDVWVNNAMTTAFQRVVDTEPEDFKRAVEVTFLGQVHGTMVALSHMRPRDQGQIVNVGSALAFLGIPLQAAYCSSKFACRGFTESVRAELAEESSNVSISLVHLPAVNTPQFDWCQTDVDRKPQPVPPIYQPEEAAIHIANAAQDGRRVKVLGSWNKLIVAIASLMPGFASNFAAVSGRSSQLTDEPIDSARPSNLRHPVDDENDYGAHGRFDGAGGVLDMGFLSNLPTTARQFAEAARRSLHHTVETLRRSGGASAPVRSSPLQNQEVGP